MKITDAQVVIAEKLASDVYDGKLSFSTAASILAIEHGLNINSARDFINDYKYMMRGRLFQRAMSASAIDYFLNRIYETRGRNSHALAVSAVNQHIEYYENLTGTNLHRMRSVLNEHFNKLSPVFIQNYEDSFIDAVKEAMADTPAVRKRRLQAAPTKPKKLPVKTYIFARNPDVVAEVLIRAQGVCERCGNRAPFNRKKDNQPYLEVHHIVQLAHGGEDRVENALALCPNCHRYQHHGILDD